jgi:aldehyde reductase
MPALGFGTLIPDPAVTITATRDALEAGFRHFDCAERYRNEREVGAALQAGLAGGGVAREDIFVTTKLWNSNHRPARVEPAFEASLQRLGLKYLDLYLIHTPFAIKTEMSFTTTASLCSTPGERWRLSLITASAGPSDFQTSV